MNTGIPFTAKEISSKDIRISLAKPDGVNRKVIGILKEAFNINQKIKLGQLHEIHFSIPYLIERNFKNLKNKHVDMIKSRYMLKVESMGNVDWYVISETNDSLNDKNIRQVTAYSLGYQLKDKYIKDWAGILVDGEYRKESLNANQVMDSLLQSTNWKLGSIDTIFMTRYRSFDFSGTTVLDAIFHMAEKFNAIVNFNNHNKTIDLIDPEKTGQFRGARISESNVMKSFEMNTSDDETVTHLKLYGQEGISIREINPTGTDFIEDFSYFMKGFKQDANGDVIQSSQFMSDGLILAILKYRVKIEDNEGLFKELLDDRASEEEILTSRENELVILMNELEIIQDTIILKQTQNLSVEEERVREASKEEDISLKVAEIESTEQSIQDISQQILDLKNALALENNYTEDQIIEMNNFIIEKTWENDNISDPEELLELGKKELLKYNKPVSVYNVGISSVSSEGKSKNILLGEKVRIAKKEINETIEAQVIEIEMDFDNNNNISLTIADSIVLSSEEDALTDLIYKSINTSATVNLNKNKWDDISSVGQKVEGILTNKWQASRNEIIGGINESVVFDRTGITVSNSQDTNRYLRMTHGVLGMTQDGGTSFSTAIDATGVYAERLVGRIIVGQQLFMENELGHFRFDQDGVTIDGNNFTVLGGENGVVISPENGISVTSADDKVKSVFNATDGIKVSVRKGTTWTDEFYYDVVNERLTVDGAIHARDLKINGEDVLTANSKIKAGAIEDLVVGGNVTMGPNATISWGNVDSKPFIPTSAEDVGALPEDSPKLTNISSTGVYTGIVTADQINTSGLIVEKLETYIGDTVVTSLHRDNFGGFLRINRNSGESAIQIRTTPILQEISIFSGNPNIQTISLNEGGLECFYHPSGSSGGALGAGVITLTEENGNNIANINKDQFTYKNRRVLTADDLLPSSKTRDIQVSPNAPSGGNDGDIWIRY